MWRKIIFAILVQLTAIQHLNSQVLIGTVVDSEYNTIGFANVYDTINKKQVTCDFVGNFILNLEEQTVLEISHSEYENKEFSISANHQSDTIFMTFVLNQKVQLVPEVIVTSERLKRMTDQSNINIVDYLPFKDFILAIKTSKSKKMLSIEGVDTTLQTFNLGKIKAKKLVEDCYGNIHLLSKDSAYQIWIDSSLQFISTSSIEKFNRLLKPCVADFSEQNVFNNFTNRNRKYTLTSIDKKTKEKDHFFHLHDEVGEQVARSHYWSIIIHYYKHIPEHKNMIELGVWDGNLLSLNLYDPDFDRMIVWYLKIRAAELNIQTFQNENSLIVFDQFSDSIRIFDEKNKVIKELSYAFAKGSTVFPILQDRYTNVFYDLSIAQGVYTLTAITPTYDESISPRQLTISEVPFATNIKIYNDWVYFLIEENGYNGLHRIKVPITVANKHATN